MRIWAVSDMHTDYKDNLEWLRALVRTGPHGGSSDGGGGGNGALGGPYEGPFDHDVLLIAGDVSDALTTLETTLQLCASAFGHVFFVPGNHGALVGSQRPLAGCGGRCLAQCHSSAWHVRQRQKKAWRPGVSRAAKPTLPCAVPFATGRLVGAAPRAWPVRLARLVLGRAYVGNILACGSAREGKSGQKSSDPMRRRHTPLPGLAPSPCPGAPRSPRHSTLLACPLQASWRPCTRCARG